MFTQRVVWAMQEPAGEFGEVVKGSEGTLVQLVTDSDDVALAEVDWDADVKVVVEAWMIDYID